MQKQPRLSFVARGFRGNTAVFGLDVMLGGHIWYIVLLPVLEDFDVLLHLQELKICKSIRLIYIDLIRVYKTVPFLIGIPAPRSKTGHWSSSIWRNPKCPRNTGEKLWQYAVDKPVSWQQTVGHKKNSNKSVCRDFPCDLETRRSEELKPILWLILNLTCSTWQIGATRISRIILLEMATVDVPVG